VTNRIRSAKRQGGSDERGAAMIEFALAATLLLVLLFGIITYGYVLSFKQGMTQAAAEGARAGAVSSTPTPAATAAVTRSVSAFNKTCGTGGLTCNINPAYTTNCAGHTCIRVQITYDYKNFPLMPKFPGIGLLLPDTLTSTSVAEIN
jgi:Flp pilus assembly protein TadG